MMNKVLVTGGGGYIGSHACKALRNRGYQPVTFDNFSTGWRDAVKFGPMEEGDLTDRARIMEAMAKHEPVAVMHFAALSDVGDHDAAAVFGQPSGDGEAQPARAARAGDDGGLALQPH